MRNLHTILTMGAAAAGLVAAATTTATASTTAMASPAAR
jgi:hypothetical protein